MRVLHIFDIYLPSTLSWVCKLMLYTHPVKASVASPWIVQNQFFRKEFQYHWFPPQQWIFPNLKTDLENVRWQKLFIASQRYIPTYPFWLYRRLKKEKPDVLHAHFGPTACLYLPLAKRLKRPLVVTFYGFDYTKLPNLKPSYKTKYIELFHHAAQVITASRVGADLLQSMGCPAEKISIIPPSPDLLDFPFYPRYKEKGRLKLVQLSTFTAKKGHLDTLDAFRQALKTCPDLHLTLAGEKWDKKLVYDIENFIQTHRLFQQITWLDTIDHSNVARFLEQFDVLIHPSCYTPEGDHEATPVILLEAQSTGLPVISTTHFDIPFEVIHGKTGLLAPENNPAQLAQYIERFYQMEDVEYQQFSHAARRHMETVFDIRKTADVLRALYSKIVNPD